jgi:hypothetical protein
VTLLSSQASSDEATFKASVMGNRKVIQQQQSSIEESAMKSMSNIDTGVDPNDPVPTTPVLQQTQDAALPASSALPCVIPPRQQAAAAARIVNGTPMERRKIFIGGLPPDATEPALGAYFGHFGEVEVVTVMKDHLTGNSRGFGFVTFEAESSAETCLAKVAILFDLCLVVLIREPAG